MARNIEETTPSVVSTRHFLRKEGGTLATLLSQYSTKRSVLEL